MTLTAVNVVYSSAHAQSLRWSPVLPSHQARAGGGTFASVEATYVLAGPSVCRGPCEMPLAEEVAQVGFDCARAVEQLLTDLPGGGPDGD